MSIFVAYIYIYKKNALKISNVDNSNCFNLILHVTIYWWQGGGQEGGSIGDRGAGGEGGGL